MNFYIKKVSTLNILKSALNPPNINKFGKLHIKNCNDNKFEIDSFYDFKFGRYDYT